MNPKGVGSLKDYRCTGSVSKKGDGVYITFTLNVYNGSIEFRYRVTGCSAVIAACSAIYELYNKRKIEEAKGANMNIISEYLGGIPKSKMRCAQYALEAFLKALDECEGL